MKTYTWKELVESRDFKHEQEFVTLEDFNEFEQKVLDLACSTHDKRTQELRDQLVEAIEMARFYANDADRNYFDKTGTRAKKFLERIGVLK